MESMKNNGGSIMNIITRIIYSMTALISGITVLLTGVFQSGTGLGFGSKPEDAIAKNFMSGYEVFIDEPVSDKWSVGYAKNELTPDNIDEVRYFLGGYLRFPAQEATGIIDELWVRAVVLDDNSGRGATAFAWIDAVGLMNEDVKLIREKLSDITELVSINVGVTHTHSAVDTQGIWGTIPETGRNQEYMDALVEKTADAIRTAYETRSEGELYYGEKHCPEYFTDGRANKSYDEYIHLLRFVPDDASRREIYISNFGAHPVNVDWDVHDISADFPYYVEKSVNEKCDADFIFIQGAIGGAIHCNRGASNGIDQSKDGFERMKDYSVKVADVLGELAETAEEVPAILNVTHAQVELSVDNFIFRLVERTKLCNVTGYSENGKIKLTTEIGYAEIGDSIKILMMPGEIFPEVVYGGFLSADKAYNGTEYPYAALNTHFDEDDSVLTFGLCNDAVGYIVPDNDYCSSLTDDAHSQEMVSVGPTAASSISKAFEELLANYR